MGDYGIKVVSSGNNVVDATTAETLMNTTYPFAKLDTTNDTSFQNIVLTFDNDPPEPSGAGTDIYEETVVYSFTHGYSYYPSFWSLIQTTGPIATNFYQDYFQDRGTVAATTAFDGVFFQTRVTTTQVQFVITKFYDAGLGGSTNDITGLELTIWPYVFVEDLGV